MKKYFITHHGQVQVDESNGMVTISLPSGSSIQLDSEELTRFAKFLFAIKREIDPSSNTTPSTSQQSVPTGRAQMSGLSYMDQQKAKHHKAYQPWTKQEETRLKTLYDAGMSDAEIAKELDRVEGAIASRLLKLGLRK